MSKAKEILHYIIMPVVEKMAAQKHLNSIRDGIIINLPFMLTGSFFLVIAFLPIDAYNHAMTSVFGDSWQSKLLYPVSATYDVMALLTAFGVAYRLAERYDTIKPLSAGANALIAFILTIPQHTLFSLPESNITDQVVDGVISMSYIGSKGLFLAIIISVITTETYRYVIEKGWAIKMPKGVPPSVSDSFSAFIPSTVVIVVVLVVRILVETTSFHDINNLIQTIVGIPMGYVGGSLIGFIFTLFIISCLWMLGLHGSAIALAFVQPIWLANMTDNLMAFQNGLPMPHIITQQFYDLFVIPGGDGSVMGLVFLLLLFSRSRANKEIGKTASIASVFNISEPVQFSVPIVMNPYFVIPLILAPISLAIVSYFAMDMGLVAKPVGIAVPFTMPIGFSGYIATGGHISGAILQFVNLAIAIAIYFPFFKAWDKSRLKLEQTAP